MKKKNARINNSLKLFFYYYREYAFVHSVTNQPQMLKFSTNNLHSRGKINSLKQNSF